MTIRVVLDTNVVLDCFVFRDPGIGSLLARMRDRTAIAITNAACFAELERVLAYRQLELAPEQRPAVLATYRESSEWFSGPAGSERLPSCRDPDDQKFLELARDARADLLVSKDKALLELAVKRFGIHGFRIITPRMFAGAIAI
jgi:uncharacterized protein